MNRSPPVQSEKFAELARALECDEDEAAFDAKLRKVAQAPQWHGQTPVQMVEECRVWFRSEATTLSPIANQAVTDALANTNHALACLALYNLRKDGLLPASWEEMLSTYWNFSR